MQLILQVQVKSLKNFSLYKCFAGTTMNLAESRDDAHSGIVLHVLRGPRHQEAVSLHKDPVFYIMMRKKNCATFNEVVANGNSWK